MHPAQEIANAFSMLLPAFVILYLALDTRHVMVTALLIGTLMHLPISFAYHVLAAFNRFPDRIDNDLRRLDQTLQHIACTIFAYTTSGSFYYAAACWKFNSFFIYKLWHPRTSNDGRRWIPINAAVHLYMLPMLWNGDTLNFVIAFESLWIGGVFFVPFINYDFLAGWGHWVFHVALAVHMYALANYVAVTLSTSEIKRM
jgi:hypothetical protein